MIRNFPNIEFILLAIVANRSQRGRFAYELPENLTEVHEVYLEGPRLAEPGDEKEINSN